MSLCFTAIDLLYLRIPFKRALKTASTTLHYRDVLVLKGTLSGNKKQVVWSECNAFNPQYYVSYSLTDCYVQLKTCLPSLLNKAFKCVKDAYKQFSHLHACSVAALDALYWQALAIQQKQTLSQVLGGLNIPLVVRHLYSTDTTLKNLNTLAPAKIKVSPDSFQYWLSIQNHIPDDSDIIFDANGCLSLEHLEGLKACKCAVEQPFKPQDVEAYQALHQEKSCPVFFDESITDQKRAFELIKTFPKFGLCLKAATLGGISPVLTVLKHAHQHKVSCRLGGMFETDIGRSLLYALASQPLWRGISDGSMASNYLAASYLSNASSIPASHWHYHTPIMIDETKLSKYCINYLHD